MDLSRLQIRARQRGAWEAVDLGFVVARRWFKPLYLAWAIPAFSLFVILSLIFWNKPWLASTLVWWLKPLWDRLPLHIASRRLFGEDVSVADTLKAMPKLFYPQWFTSLTWRRLSPTRSHDLPITCLERLKGNQRSRRISVLHMTSGTPAMWLTVLCVHIEGFLWLATLVLLYLFIPQSVDFNPTPWALEGSLWLQHASNLLIVLSATLIAPFYTMGGFMLYISRRIDLEAWDLEIRFRNLAETKSRANSIKPASGNSKVAPMLLLACTICAAGLMGDANTAYAQETLGEARSYISSEESKKIIEEVFEGEDFSRTREVSGWRFKEQEETDSESERELPDWLQRIVDAWNNFWDWVGSLFDFDGEGDGDPSSIGGFFAGLNILVKAVLICAAIALIAWLLMMISRTAGKGAFFSARRKSVDETPEVLFGLDVRPESMPKNVPERVRELASGGDTRAAMAMLYGALLSKLIHELNYRFYDGHTEWECAQIVAESAEQSLALLMSNATLIWQQLAYADQEPSGNDIERLCGSWEELFDE